ncbi:MAG TPA: hypothetical protein VJT67_04750 [Longimicrobiaceae bacterium]|nr:hypothetical protein [Longimicrobiaceae bacterium]
MDDSDKIEILKEQIASLRSEVVRYSDSQRTIARYAVIGTAAVVALRKDLPNEGLESLLPILPIVAMGMFAIMVLENVFIFRAGRWLAAAEIQLNALAGEDFLQYEQSIRDWRSNWLAYHPALTTLFLILASAAYYWCFFYLSSFSDLSDPIIVVLWILAIIAHLFALIYFIRMVGELRAGIPTLPPTFAHDLGSPPER